MFTTGSKLLIGASLAAAVFAAVYGIAQGGTLALSSLNLFGSPACVCVPHVRRRFDGRYEFESDIAHSDKADNTASNDAQDSTIKNEASDKDVDCMTLRSRFYGRQAVHSQTPRPRKENKKLAYFGTYGGTCGSNSRPATPIICISILLYLFTYCQNAHTQAKDDHIDTDNNVPTSHDSVLYQRVDAENVQQAFVEELTNSCCSQVSETAHRIADERSM